MDCNSAKPITLQSDSIIFNQDTLKENIDKYIFEIEESRILNKAQFTLNIEITCQLCSYLLIRPVECTKCLSMICIKCKDRNNSNCPYCKEKTKFNEIKKYHTYYKLLKNLLINCPKECKTVVSFDEYENHIINCSSNNIGIDINEILSQLSREKKNSQILNERITKLIQEKEILIEKCDSLISEVNKLRVENEKLNFRLNLSNSNSLNISNQNDSSFRQLVSTSNIVNISNIDR
jgi:regulator of replication initiation timing